jgi:hypothetical protein
MPIGMAKLVLGLWKSAGGATWVWVAEPGWAQTGALGAGVVGAMGVCAWSTLGTAISKI